MGGLNISIPILMKRVAPVLVAALLLSAQDPGKGNRGGRPAAAWEENFSGPLDKKKWAISNTFAPGYRSGIHLGYYDAGNVVVQGGYAVLRLWQEPGNVEGNPDGVISHGAHLATKQKYGYGTYEWRMRMASTATSPAGEGEPVCGGVSAGFVYVNNSETEIDFEFGGHQPDVLHVANWHNTAPLTGPFDDQMTVSSGPLPGISDDFHTYRFVWEAGQISYYVDGVLLAVHTTNVPTAPASIMINHWGTENPFWGGLATFGVERFLYVDWVRFTPPLE